MDVSVISIEYLDTGFAVSKNTEIYQQYGVCQLAEPMIPRQRMDMAGTSHGFGRDAYFTQKSGVSDTIQHNSLLMLKYPCIIGSNLICP